ncbi:hypothetical protein Tco_1034658 [Tanacetum coccineum]
MTTLVPCEDRYVWTLESDGVFSVASIRKEIDGNRFQDVSLPTRYIEHANHLQLFSSSFWYIILTGEEEAKERELAAKERQEAAKERQEAAKEREREAEEQAKMMNLNTSFFGYNCISLIT